MLKINKIVIEKFRRFNNVEFKIDNCLTLIAGQNGTSKSTLLGMLSQPFSFGVKHGKKSGKIDNSKYTDNYHGENLKRFRDLSGNLFNYDCEDVFRLSKLHDTQDKNYFYKLHLSGDCITSESPIYNTGLMVRTQLRPDKTRIRFVAGPKKSSEAGEGNFPHPVIYFGLERHWPLALVKKIQIGNHSGLTDIDKNWLIDTHNYIFCMDENTNTVESVSSDRGTKGDFIGISSTNYNSESISAGQDCLNQILTALLSFKLLKEKLGKKYHGGLILIDEIDSTLHAIAQERLLEILCTEAEKYQLQIVGTTHSLYMLQYALESKFKDKTKLIYLKKEDGNVIDSGYSTFKEIDIDLKAKAQPKSKIKNKKVDLIFEDKVGKNMFSGIIGNKLNKYISNVDRSSIDGPSLKNLAPLVEKISELSRIILIPDGDFKTQIPAKISEKLKNLIFLPGDSRPENLMYECLKTLKDVDPFWKACPAHNHSRQTIIIKHGNPVGTTPDELKKWYKQWYNDQSQYWGRTERTAWEKWAQQNKVICKQFCVDFFKILNRLTNGAISKKVRDKILSNYS